MLRALPVVLVLTFLSLSFAVPAQAVLITVNFTVTGNFDDPLYPGQTFAGSFSFDSSIVPAPGTGFVNVGAFDNTTDYASSINFTFDGTTWTENNAGLIQLQFDDGQLHGWVLKGDPPPANGFQLSQTEADFIVHTFSGGTGYAYSHPGTYFNGFGSSVTWTVTTSDGSAPEPASWMLLGGALVGLVGARRRARK